MKRRVGILGGMGPQATILVMQKVLAGVRATDDADHVPLIVDQNPQVPSRIRHILDGEGADPGPVLAAMARRLESCGAEALAMPCNTAHHYAPYIREAVSVPLLDMIDLSTARAANPARAEGVVGILASPAVRRIGLFDHRLERHGLRALYPSDEEALLAAIRSIKAEGAAPADRETLRSASEDMLRRGARVQLIACTEFSLIADSVARGAVVLDALDCLTEEIIRFAG